MLTPLDPKLWDEAKAGHLLNRAGFGGSPEQIEAVHAAGFDRAVAALLNAPDDSQQFPKPADIGPVDYPAMRAQMAMLPEEEKKKKNQETQKQQRGDMLELVGWWL